MKRVVITGGGSGIGAAIAARAREDGFETITIDRENGDVYADLTNEQETSGAFEEILQSGPVYGLVNNVGSIRVSDMESLEVNALEWSMKINFQSTLLATQAVVPAMKEQGIGRIVNISSRAVLGKVGRTAYSAAKAAVLGASRTWALEFGAHGITVNAIAPGPIRTPLWAAANPAGAPETQKIIDTLPVNRLGEPEDIAHSVSHFIDERAGFVTGQVLYVCGGMTVGLSQVM